VTKDTLDGLTVHKAGLGLWLLLLILTITIIRVVNIAVLQLLQ